MQLKIQPAACRVARTDLAYFLCAHELYTGCRLGVKRSRAYNVTNWVETYCCRNFVSCPFELKLMAFQDDVDSVYFDIAAPHLHESTREVAKPFYSIQLFLKRNVALSYEELVVSLREFLNASINAGDLIGSRHRFQFKTLPLGRTTAFVLEDIMPRKCTLLAKQAYYRRQARELRREDQEAERELAFAFETSDH